MKKRTKKDIILITVFIIITGLIVLSVNLLAWGIAHDIEEAGGIGGVIGGVVNDYERAREKKDTDKTEEKNAKENTQRQNDRSNP